MDALILSCGTGGGHDAAAQAVKEEFIRNGHNAVMMNPYTLQSSRLASRINRIYISLVQKCPAAFGVVYIAGELYRRLPFRSPVYFVNGKMADTMGVYLEKNHFDIIIMPHVFPAEILTYMKNNGMDVPKMIFIATDYACIPFTEESDCDAYIIPDKGLKKMFTSRGIPAERIYPLGIPVQSGFLGKMSAKEAREVLGLDIGKKYILISGGSVGSGEIAKALEMLYKRLHYKYKVQFIVICGNNDKLYRKLKTQYGNKIRIIRHTDKIDVYMKACDLYITKPGGLSSTEAAVMGIPLVHLPPIPGCESLNLYFFTKHGMSKRLRLSEKGISDILKIMGSSSVRKEMLHRQQMRINKNAAADILSLACEMTGR